MLKPNRFSEADFGRIREAVLQAEAKISGEIVPVFVENSGHYKVAVYRGGITGMMLFFLLVILLDRYYPAFAVYDPILIFLITVLGAIIGMLLPHYLPAVKRALLSAGAFNHFFFSCLPRFNVLSSLGQIRVPTLILCGKHDWIMPPHEGSHRLHQEIGRAHV